MSAAATAAAAAAKVAPRVVVAGTGFVAIRAHLAAVAPRTPLAMVERAAILDGGVEAQVLIPAMSRIDGPLMDRVAGLRLIQQWGVGLEGVDVAAASARGIAVARVASEGTGNAESVAEWCVMAAIALGRQLAVVQAGLRAGAAWGGPAGRALLGRRAGIVGMGGIGQALAARLAPFGMSVRGVGRRADPALAARLGLDWIGGPERLDELLSGSDHLFLCLPLTAETRRIIDAAALARLPHGACLINPSRGGLIDHGALLEALDQGRLSGAALDVFDHEPLDPASPLLTRPQILATPHIAGITDASYGGIALRVADNLQRLADGRPLTGCVNADALGR
jgi:phosphoglycerate dehydrogenase-like enzyme